MKERTGVGRALKKKRKMDIRGKLEPLEKKRRKENKAIREMKEKTRKKQISK